MKSFENIDAKSVNQAVALLQKFHQEKKTAIVVSGGSEILQLMKDHVVMPDYVVNLKTIPGLNTIKEERGGFRIGGLTTLADIEEHPGIREKLLILPTPPAMGSAADSQRRHPWRQSLTAVLLVFSLIEFHLPAQGRTTLLLGHRGRRFHDPGRRAELYRSSLILRQRWSHSGRKSKSPGWAVKEPFLWRNSSCCRRWT
jgi:hypothetical protein